MFLQQLDQRLSITPHSVKEIEEAEKNGIISINVLKNVAFDLDRKFVYSFKPKEKLVKKVRNTG